MIVGSDLRYKDNIETMTNATSFIESLHPCMYELKNDTEDKCCQYGLIAQEVEQAMQTLGLSSNNGIVHVDKKGFYGLAYTEFIPWIIRCLQEMNQRIKTLESDATL